MPVALPMVTRREIVGDFRLDETTIDNGIRSLKAKHALSPGVSVTRRAAAGHLGGRVHLYSALNRDAARAARLKDFVRAREFAGEAAKLDASPESRRIANSLSVLTEPGSTDTAAGLARSLARPELSTDVIELQRKLAKVRARLAVSSSTDTAPAQFSGHVVSMNDFAALVDLKGMPGPLTVPVATLIAIGLAVVGAAVVASWEMLSAGRTVLSVEPAIEMPDVNELGEPLVDVYGSPWGQVLTLQDADALRVSGRSTVRIPRGIPEVM